MIDFSLVKDACFLGGGGGGVDGGGGRKGGDDYITS